MALCTGFSVLLLLLLVWGLGVGGDSSVPVSPPNSYQLTLKCSLWVGSSIHKCKQAFKENCSIEKSVIQWYSTEIIIMQQLKYVQRICNKIKCFISPLKRQLVSLKRRFSMFYVTKKATVVSSLQILEIWHVAITNKVHFFFF